MECCCNSHLQYLCHDLSGWALIEYIVFCHILWWIFYCFLLVSTRQSKEWCCRFLTLFHGCLVSFAAIQELMQNGTYVDFQSAPLTTEKKNYLAYMLSYFLFDFCWIHFFGNETWIIYAHHLASIFIIINVLIKNYGGGGMSFGVAGLEITNPYLQLRWFLRTHGYLNKPIHTVTELWFMFLFFVIRTVGGTVLLYYGLFLANTDIGMKLSFISIYGISQVLQWQIFLYFRKKYLRPNRSMNFILSTTSISPYFQRRTLDPPDYDYSIQSDILGMSAETGALPTTSLTLDSFKPDVPLTSSVALDSDKASTTPLSSVNHKIESWSEAAKEETRMASLPTLGSIKSSTLRTSDIPKVRSSRTEANSIKEE